MDSDDSLAEHAKLERISSIIAKNALTNDIGSDNATSIKNLHPVVAQQMLQPRCKSSVWVYFQRLDTALAKCRICHNNYRFGSSISNLRHHAELKHADVLRQGPVKFLERLKVPKEDVAKLMITTREKAKRSNKIKNLHEELLELSDATHVKLEPTPSGESNFSGNEDEDMQQTIDSIYEKSDDILNDYLQTSPKSTTTASTKRKTRGSTSIPHVDCSNNSYFLDDDEEETDIDCLRSDNFISTNPLNTTANARNGEKMLYLREERLRAETNYFDKKAVFMERSTEFIEIQKRHVMLQTHKLKLEITAMKDSLYRP